MMRSHCFPFSLTIVISAYCVQGTTLGIECSRMKETPFLPSQTSQSATLTPAVATGSLCFHSVQTLIRSSHYHSQIHLPRIIREIGQLS